MTSIRMSALALVLAASASNAQSSVIPLEVVDTAFMDTTAKACTDFNQFANGRWLAHDTIPAAYSSSGVARDMTNRNELVVRSVLDDVMAKRATYPAGGTQRKLGTFYATCMDSSAADRAGLDPVRPTLAAASAVTTRAQLLDEIATLQSTGHNVLFHYFPSVDPHDPVHYVATLWQGGLGLPDRDYYTREGAGPDSVRHTYLVHVARLLTLSGESPAAANADAQRVYDLEKKLAEASLTRVAMRDPAAVDHPMTEQQLAAIAPHVSWARYFHNAGVDHPVTKLNIGQPAFIARADSLLASESLANWKAYLRYHVLSSAAPWLSTPYVKESFAFSSTFSGAKELLPRWKRCLRETDDQMGEALGEAYVAKTFPPEAKRRAKQVIDDIRTAFAARLKNLTWMSDTTKARALDKLSKMHEKVGYPDKWRDYSKLDVRDDAFVLNDIRANQFEWKRTANRPGEAVDTTEWDMTVPTVNAYYDPTKNEMVFPAGALTPQTFDPNADDGANYGSLGGSWAGHELTHGFDDQGRHYDASGSLRDWWQPSDSATFAKLSARIVSQYDGYIQVDTFHVNGALTEGENIADNGGLLTGYDALERALERDGRPGLIEGFTPEQRFFIGFAQSFRGHERDESLRTRVTVDPHSPDRWRVNGPVSNSVAFAKAFGCKEGDPMVRPRAEVPDIW
ncbi:MAG TPA: M13 family metallopeptidase [Gemmatimonadaceae bacterium]|nr:M13 family metallopeptidase [Gemmatimonadaceae bacterium]